eukprot:7385520-Prymnesium_polylepis.2
MHPFLGAYVAEHRRNDSGRTILVWPLVQYNISGAVVAAAARRYGVAAHNVVVLHDDMDTKVGVLKWRHSGSAGGNGVKSVIRSLGTDGFSRLRVGVGRPASKDQGAVISFVLGDVPDDDLDAIRSAFQREELAQHLLERFDHPREGETPTAAAQPTATSTVPALLLQAFALVNAYLATVTVGLKWLVGAYSTLPRRK